MGDVFFGTCKLFAGGYITRSIALVAQLVEQVTLNHRVQGSSPCGGISKLHTLGNQRFFMQLSKGSGRFLLGALPDIGLNGALPDIGLNGALPDIGLNTMVYREECS
jgi:hypothetical protein